MTDHSMDKRMATPEEMAQREQERTVRSTEDPTARVTNEGNNEAEPSRIQPPSFGAKPGHSALEFAEEPTLVDTINELAERVDQTEDHKTIHVVIDEAVMLVALAMSSAALAGIIGFGLGVLVNS